MPGSLRRFTLVVGLLVAGLSPLPAEAIQIITFRTHGVNYEVEDLPDQSGLDLWRYRYQIWGSWSPFDAGAGLSVLFDPASYGALSDPSPADATWDAIVLQPDPLIPDAGRYDVQALVDDPTRFAEFHVTFVWLGVGVPGSQPYEIYDPSFQKVGGGNTSIPEPTTATLLALGMGLLTLHARRRSGIPVSRTAPVAG